MTSWGVTAWPCTVTQSTIGILHDKLSVSLPDYEVDLIIWDTAGQERFNAITTQHFRIADACVLVYDASAGLCATVSPAALHAVLQAGLLAILFPTASLADFWLW
jgi:GTPase SAR1 family protein